MTDQNDNLKETLSALMDNEASEFELRRVLKAMDQDEAEHPDSLKSSWHRYHIVRTLLDEQSRAVSASGFLAGIQAEIQESSPDFPESLPKERSATSAGFVRIAGQGLIAASVAVLALAFSFSLLQKEDGPQGFESAANGNDSSQNLTAQNTETLNFTSELDPEDVEQLRRAVLRDLGGEEDSLQIPVRFSIDDYQD